MRGLFPISHPAIACSGIECYPYRLIFKGVIVAVHLLIVDALNLIRRIHAVQGSPCVETCQHARSAHYAQPANPRGRRFDDENRSSGWRHRRLHQITKRVDRQCRKSCTTRCLHYAPPLSNAASRAGPPAATKTDDLAATLAVKVTQAGHQATVMPDR